LLDRIDHEAVADTVAINAEAVELIVRGNQLVGWSFSGVGDRAGPSPRAARM
jgi:hypothetical protein